MEDRIELLNSEGPILVAERKGITYYITYMNERRSEEIEKTDLSMFLGGFKNLVSPGGEVFQNYPDYPEGMRPDYFDLYTFMSNDGIKSIVYLASPYTHKDDSIREERYRKISQIAADLNKEGILAFSPITYCHTLLEYAEMPTNWSFWQSFCISFLQHCDELWVYKMEGWDRSQGIAEEIKFAEKNGILVKYIDVE